MIFVRALPLAVVLFASAAAARSVDPDDVLPGIRPVQFPVDALEIRIDGRLDEPVWADLPVHDDFFVIDPDTLARPEFETEVRFAYTDDGLYVGVTAHQDPDTLVAVLTPRDGRVNRDSISITIDPSGEGLYGYWFSVNLGGSITDGTVVPEREFSRQWDGPWQGAAAEIPSGWTAEYFLPWSMMAMPPAGPDRRIAFYISRKVAHTDQRYAMPALPSTRPRFMSVLRPIELTDIQPQRQLTFYPFSALTVDARESDLESQLGADVYWRPNAAVQLSATLNPDFGTIEQDDLVVNLSANEVFFSEKRAFFLEGQEVFVTSPRAAGNYIGGPPIILVNTRRIGAPPPLPDDDRVETFSEIDRRRLSDLFGATKAAGQVGEYRYGVFAAAEQGSEVSGFDAAGRQLDFDVEGRNFAAARLLREITDDGRYRAVGGMVTAVNRPGNDAFVGSLDGHLLTADGRFKVDGQAMFSHAEERGGYGLIGDVVYTPEQGRTHRIGVEYLDDEFDLNDFGFLQRDDQVLVDYRFQRRRSDLDHVRDRSTDVRLRNGFNLDGKFISSGLFVEREWTLHSLNQLRAEIGLRPERWDDRNSRGNGAFRVDDRGVLELGFESNNARPLFVALDLGARHEDLQGLTLDGGMSVTWRPSDRLTADVGVEYRDRNGWLVYRDGRDFTTYDAIEWRPNFTLDYFFSARQQLRASMQYVAVKASEQEFLTIRFDGDLVGRGAPEQSEDFAISSLVFQLRYRWEIAPLSDLFVVYTRGGTLDETAGRTFPELFTANFEEPDDDQLVVKLRYRLGT